MNPFPAIILAALFLPATALAQETQHWANTLSLPSAYTSHSTTDASGNVYVAGGNSGTSSFSYTLIKYNASGVQEWVVNGPSGSALYAPLSFPAVVGMGVDGSGNVYITSNAFDGLLTTAYNSSGQQRWSTLTSQNLYCIGYAMTVDASGNVYVVAQEPANGSCVTLKLGAGGNLQWSALCTGIAGGNNLLNYIAVDASGNVYAGGVISSLHSFPVKGLHGIGTIREDTSTDIITIKYNPSGTVLWTSLYNAGYQINDYSYGMTLDPAGNVYVIGGSSGPDFGSNEIIAYSTTDGARLWMDLPPLNLANGNIAVDPSGNILTESPITNGFTINKYTSSGAVDWAYTYGSPTTYNPARWALALDNQGNSYVAGTTGAGPAANYTITQVTSTGSLGWQETYNGPAGGSDVAGGICIFTPASRLGAVTNPEVNVTGTANNLTAINTIQYTHLTGALAFAASSADSLIGDAATLGTPVIAVLSNYPNPFHGATTITYTLPQDGHVILQIYDAAGHPIATLANDDESAGLHTLPFNANRLASGIYQYRIIAQSPRGAFTQTKQMVIQ